MEQMIIPNASSNNWILRMTDSNGGDTRLLTNRVTDFDLPTISSTPIIVGGGGPLAGQLPSNSIMYTPMDYTFIVDENFKNYLDVLNWMRQNALGENLVDDIEIEMVQGNGRAFDEPVKFKFKTAFPTSLGQISMDSRGDTQVLKATVEFTFNTLQINGVNIGI